MAKLLLKVTLGTYNLVRINEVWLFRKMLNVPFAITVIMKMKI